MLLKILNSQIFYPESNQTEDRCIRLRRSKLECYEAILEALVKSPLTIDSIAYKTGMDCTILGQRLEFLISNGLVEKRTLNKKKQYAITERGVAVYRTLNFQKYLEKVTKAIRVMDEAMHVIPIISEQNNKTENKP
jgi:predicted transcriptional regulator